MDFKDAARFVFPFGKHKGKTLDTIAQDDNGLSYLDWALGLDNLYPATKDALTAYLHDPSIAKELQALKNSREDRH